ncbi:hypothetical protein BaRGS_00002812, partial [Batillaria attramentaria]
MRVHALFWDNGGEAPWKPKAGIQPARHDRVAMRRPPTPPHCPNSSPHLLTPWHGEFKFSRV